MKYHRPTFSWLRIVIASVLAAASGLAISASGGQAALEYDPGASGGTAGIGELTRFEIDGDRVPGVSSNSATTPAPGVDADWESTPYGPQPIGTDPAQPAPAGIGSSGLLPLLFTEIKADDYPTVSPAPNPAFGVPGLPNNTEEFCVPAKEDAWVGGTKVQDVSIDNPLFTVDGAQALECAIVLDKGDLFSTYTAYETVAIPNVYGDPNSGSQNHTIIYGAWERAEVPGELNFYIPIADAVPGNSAGDRLIAFDYDSSAPASYRILRWSGTGWIVDSSGTAATNDTTFAAAVGFADGSPFAAGTNRPSFGEFALDLTATGILPGDDGPCVELSTAGYVFTETGNSANAQLKDFVGAPAIPISNCGPLSVTKAGPDGVTNSPLFDFRVEQQDSEPIFDTVPVTTPASTSSQYNDQFVLGETVTLDQVLAQPDYVAFEEPVVISGLPPADLPAGWTMISVDCTFIDGFRDGYPIVTEQLYLDGSGRLLDDNGDQKVFQVHSTAFNTLTGNDGFVPNCVITNDAAGIVVAKETLPDGSLVEFPFTVTDGVVNDGTDLADGESAFFAFDAGTEVTITEGAVADTLDWNLTDISCTNENGTPATITSETDDSVTLAVGAVDNTITCTFTNTQNGAIVIDKTGVGVDAGTADFTFDVSGTPAGPIKIGGSTGAIQVAPGQYDVSEDQPVVGASTYDFVLTDVTCDTPGTPITNGQTVTVDPGQTVTCTFTNDQRGPVTITKDAVLVDPAPVDGTIDQFDVRYTVTATSASNVVEDIDVVDAFDFPTSLTVVGGPTVSGAASTPGWTGAAPNTTLYSGPIAANGQLVWTIDVRVQLDLDAPAAERDCSAGGSGAWNDVNVSVDDVVVDQDDACVSFGDPTITVDKTVVGDVTVNPDLSMMATYEIDVANTGDGPGSYELSDAFGFPTWVTVSDVDVTGPAGVLVDPDFDGQTLQGITTGPVGLGAGVTDTYTITVTFTAAPTATADGAVCATGPGDGLFNLATITSTSGGDTDDACIDIPRGQIVVTKATLGGTGTFGFTGVALFPGNAITTTTADGTPSAPISAWVTPGSYGLTETAPAGWTKITEPCTDFSVADGETVSCDYVNGKQSSITVQKVADPAGTFEFTFGPSNEVRNVASGGAGSTWSGLDAGAYSLTETVTSPWQLLSAACDGVDYTNGDPINLGWGEDITCVFSNEALAEIVISKTTDPVTDPTVVSFDFTGDLGDFSIGHGEQESSGLVVADAYTVSELVPSGWDLTGLVCSVESLVDQPTGSVWTYGGDATFADGDTSAEIDLAPGDRVSCEFTNTQRGQIVVTKQIADGTATGDALLQTFDFDLDGDFGTDEQFTLDGNGDGADGTASTETFEVRPGAYSVAETVPADWNLDGVVCTDAQDPSTLTVDPGATVECTFTNSPDPADVTIRKSVVNVASDFAWSFDFTIAPDPDGDGGQDATKPAAGTGPTTVSIGWTGLIPGQQYTISETVPANWTQSGLVCVGLTDLDQDPTDASVTFVAQPGQSLSCSVTNTPDDPTITIVKTTVGDVGTFDFEVTPENDEDTLIEETISTDADGVAKQGTTYSLLTGLTYSVDELDPGSAWAEGALDCGTFGTAAPGAAVDVTGQPGDDIVCEISNSALGNITVIKSTVGADGTFGFEINDEPFAIETTVGSGQEDFQNLQPGQYVITETDPTANFDGTQLACVSSNGDVENVDLATLTATVDLSNGETVVCTFTNTERAHIVVDKITNPSGDATQFTFTETWTPETGGSFQLADADAPHESGPIPSNVAYTLVEAPTPGWVVTGFVCTGGTNEVVYDVDTNDADGASATITPAPGETILCEVTNNLRGPVTIAKDAAPASISRTGDVYTVVYDLTVGTESYITEDFTLTDTPAFAAGTTIQSTTVTDESDVEVSLPLNGSIDPGETLVYTVTIDFTIDGALPLADRVCSGTGTATFNSATVTYGVEPGTSTDDDCVDLPDPDIGVTKTVVANPSQPVYQGGNEYTVDYDIVVTNDGEGPGSYTLVEDPDFGTGIDVTAISAASTDGTVDPAFALGSLTLADGVDLQADESHTYTVTVTFTIAGDATLAARDCAGPGTATYNSVSLSYNGVDGGQADDCVDLPDPDITVDKAVATGQPVHVGDNVYTVEYTVTVDNVGDGPGAYDLVDTPDFGTGATVTNVTVTGNGVDIDQDGDAPVTIITGESIDPDETPHVYTVTVTFEVAGSMTTEARTCATGEERAGFGAYNGADVTYNDGLTAEDDDCVDIPEPDVSIIKSLDAANPLVANGDGTWTIGYLLSVSNAAAAGPAEYDLTDAFDFPAGVTVDDVTVQIVGTDPAADVLVAGFDGAAQSVVAADVRIDDGETHVYRILVDLTIEVVPGIDGDCTGDGGLVNTMSVSVRGDEPLTDDACDSFSTLTLVKEVVNDDGANGDEGDFTLSADGPVLVTGVTPVAAAVPAGTYDLSETEVDGYTLASLTCDNAEGDVTSVQVGDGEQVTCTFVNDDEPVDLEITKDDGGVVAVAGGDPFDYTITVRNVGTRDADLGEPVTVTDELPSPLQWVSFPANCSQAGQTLTCDIDPALMTVGGDPVVITASVRAPADAPSGIYTNQVSVTTEDDPVCEGEGCTPPPCPALDTNNVDCEETPVDREGAIQIVKTDDVATGDSVIPGEEFSYSLVVTNTGVSTILPGLVVTDDLPAQLELVSVSGGAGWSCNDVDPIECTFAPSLAPGATAPTITVDVQVAATASGASIPNTAVVVGAVDRECPPLGELTEVFVPACNQVTDSDDETTPLTANADLAIVKSASVTTTGPDGAFNWTLVVTNNGPGTAVNVEIDDLVPSSLTVGSVTSTFFTCGRTGNAVSCTRPSMVPGASGTITIAVTVNGSAVDGSIVNVGTVESQTPDPDLTNNSDDASVDVVIPLPPPPEPPPVTLPQTGSDSTGPLVRAALWLVLLGGAVLLVTRRRRGDVIG